MAARSYSEWLNGKLSDPVIVEHYLREAALDSPEVLAKAIQRVAKARELSNGR